MRTLYRMFARGQYNFNAQQLPMKDKRHPNGYVERRGKAGQLGRSIYQRYQDTSLMTRMSSVTLKPILFKAKPIVELS